MPGFLHLVFQSLVSRGCDCNHRWMSCRDEQDILLTNSEVAEIVLQESTTVTTKTGKESLSTVLASLVSKGGETVAIEPRSRIENLVKELTGQFQLTKEEILQLVNHRPKTVLEAFLCVEQAILEGRIKEEDLENIVKLL